MAVSPSDFALYSRVTGRPVPTDRGARMKMAPEVSRFIRNRGYERPQKTALQKGADFLGKAALLGGALAAGHAIGGGFKGKTGENVGKVADVVQNLAKTGVVGAEGGDSGLDFVISGGSPVSYGQPPTSGGNIDLGEVDNTILPSQPEVSAQIESPGQKVDSWLATNAAKYGLAGEETGQLLEDAREANKPAQGYYSRQADHIADDLTQKAIDKDDFYERRLPPNDGGGGGGGPLAPVAPQPTEIVTTTPESSEMTSNEGGLRQKAEELGNNIEAHVKNWYHLDNEKIGYQIQGALENENPLVGAAQAAGVIVPALGKQGLLNAGQTAQGLYGYGKEFMGDYADTVRQGYERAKDIALSDQIRRSSMGVGGGKVLGGDFSVSGSPLLYGLQNQVDQGWGRHDAAIAPLAKNIQAAFGITLPTGQVAIDEAHQLNRHPDRPPGETDMAPSRNRAENDRKSDWENVSLNQYNKYASFKDKDISGEGSLTPDDIEIRTDIDAEDPVIAKSLYGRRVGRGEKQKFITGLKARNEDVYSGEGTSGMRRGSSSLLNPVTGEVKGSSPDYETYLGSDSHVYREDVANALRQKYLDASLLKGYKRGQEARLPARKEGTGFTLDGKRGTGSSVGELGSLSGQINFNSPDDRPKNPIQEIVDAVKEGVQLGAQKEAAEEVGRKMAEREEQGSTEWVRSPDGKLRRKKIDDPWDS